MGSRLLALLAPALVSASWVLLWSDEFDAPTLNTSLWNVLNATSEGSNQIELYDADNVYVQNGSLVLRTRLQNVTVGGTAYNVTSGRVDTSNKKNVTGGLGSRVEVRAQLQADDAYGIHSAHWLLGYDCWPRGGELDIMELEVETAGWVRSTSNVHISVDGCGEAFDLNKDGSGHWPAVLNKTHPVDFTQWHTFSLDWNVTDVVFSVDADLVRAWHVGWDGRWNVTLPTGDMFLILSQAYMAARKQNPPPSAWPIHQLVDYVRVYGWEGA